MKGTELVFEAVEIDTACGADATVRHVKQGRGNEKPFEAAVINMRREGDDVLDDAATDGNDDALLVAIMLLEEGQHPRYSVERFFLLGRRQGQSRKGSGQPGELRRIALSHVLIQHQDSFRRGLQQTSQAEKVLKKINVVIPLAGFDRQLP